MVELFCSVYDQQHLSRDAELVEAEMTSALLTTGSCRAHHRAGSVTRVPVRPISEPLRFSDFILLVTSGCFKLSTPSSVRVPAEQPASH